LRTAHAPRRSHPHRVRLGGRLKLAVALLVDVTGRQPPEAAVDRLERAILRRLPSGGFTLSDVDLELWLHVEGFDPAHWLRRP